MKISKSLLPSLAIALLVAPDAFAGPIRKLTLDPDAQVVPLFDGIEQGLFEVVVRPADEFEANLFITNTTDQPLTVSLPPALAAVQVLHQFLPQGNPFQQGNGLNNGLGNPAAGAGQAQSTVGQAGPFNNSSVLGNNAFPNGNLPPGNFLFSIPPEKTVHLEFHSVCAEHGRQEPLPGMRYELRPIEDVAQDSTVHRLIETADMESADRLAVQAAVWHLENGLTWEQLAAKRVGAGGVKRSYFTSAQLREARELIDEARQIEEAPEPAVSTASTTAY